MSVSVGNDLTGVSCAKTQGPLLTSVGGDNSDHYIYLLGIDPGANVHDLDHDKAIELAQIRHLLGVETCDLYRGIESDKAKLVEVFGEYIVDSIGPLDGFGKPKFSHLDVEDPVQKRLMRIREISGGGFLGKCKRYLKAFRQRTQIESQTLYMQTLYYAIEQQAYRDDVSAEDLRTIKEYLITKLDIPSNHIAQSSSKNEESYEWARQTLSDPALAGSYLMLMRRGQRLYHEATQGALANESSGDADPLQHISLILHGKEDSRARLLALEELGRLSQITALDETCQLAPNPLALRLYDVRCKVNASIEKNMGWLEWAPHKLKNLFSKLDSNTLLLRRLDRNEIGLDPNLESILDQVEAVTVDATMGAYLNEQQLVHKIQTASQRKALLVMGGVVTVAAIPAGIIAYNYSQNTDYALLQTRMQELSNHLQSTDFNALLRNEYAVANDQIPINVNGLKGTALVREWNKVFKPLSLLLLDKPSDGLIRQGINTFLNNSLQRAITAHPAHAASLNQLADKCRDYLNNRIDADALGDYIFPLDLGIKATLPFAVRELATYRQIESNQVLNVPPRLMDFSDSNYLRDVYGDDYYKNVRGFGPLQRFPTLGWAPMNMIGPEVVVFDERVRGHLLQVILQTPGLWNDPGIQRRVFHCWRNMHERVQSSLVREVHDHKTSIQRVQEQVEDASSDDVERLSAERDTLHRGFQDLVNTRIPLYAWALRMLAIPEERVEGLDTVSLPSL